MKSRISRAFLLLLSIVMLNSCEEDELVSTNKVVKDDAVSLKNGFLVFSDYSSFLETKKNVIELPENELLLLFCARLERHKSCLLIIS